jgi:hypothetical protein
MTPIEKRATCTDPSHTDGEGPLLPLRLAIVSTPRSGNTWLRFLLSDLYGVPGLTAHNPGEADWMTLPPACLLQIHWHRTGPFLTRLTQHRFRVVTISRHPLDVLISLLHHALHTLEDRALEGQDGSERCLVGAMPRSTAFLHYATSPRAATLLSITSQWWRAPGVRALRYEALVGDPEGELRDLSDSLGVETRRSIAEVTASLTIAELRARTSNERHFWVGRPGLWRRLLTAAEACAIASVHAGVFAGLGYECDPDPHLGAAEADANWVGLMRAERADEIGKRETARQALADLRQRFRQTEARLEETRRALAEAVRCETSRRWPARFCLRYFLRAWQSRACTQHRAAN